MFWITPLSYIWCQPKVGNVVLENIQILYIPETSQLRSSTIKTSLKQYNYTGTEDQTKNIFLNKIGNIPKIYKNHL